MFEINSKTKTELIKPNIINNKILVKNIPCVSKYIETANVAERINIIPKNGSAKRARNSFTKNIASKPKVLNIG